MIKTTVLPAVLVAMLASTALVGGAIAQSADTPERNTMGEAAATAQSSHQVSVPLGSGAALEWVGKPVAAIDGTKVGTVSEVRTNDKGTVTEVRARVGGLFGLFTREIAIPVARILLEQNGTLVAEMSVEEIEQARPVSG
jgi:hypothetical protein